MFTHGNLLRNPNALPPVEIWVRISIRGTPMPEKGTSRLTRGGCHLHCEAERFFLKGKVTGASHNQNSSVRVVVVDDFAPFLNLICSTLKRKSGLQIVGAVSDGLEAVRQAEELQPDLILLDIGLPTLTGLEAARRIRKLAPKSKIIFVTQESSPDVVRAGLNLGALGYVLKVRAETDLLAAVEAVLEGRQFVSGVFSGQQLTGTSPAPPGAD